MSISESSVTSNKYLSLFDEIEEICFITEFLIDNEEPVN
jgi:hypothetical protein